MIGNRNNKRNELIHIYQKQNKNQHQFSGMIKTSPTKKIVQSINEPITTTVIETTDTNMITTISKINNIHFGEDIRQEPQAQSTRIFFRNVNGLEFNTTSHTILETCKGMQDKQIYIACLAETHTNWNHFKGRQHLNRIVRQYWNKAHLTVSNIENKVKILYQLRGIAIVTTNFVNPRITDSGVDSPGVGR